ncbi:MAG: hypothetical protein K2Y27_24990 [Xanthobacteraceae bacterium]|nr:hypothetical protein [Xanthobacteraceae bacterium]
MATVRKRGDKWHVQIRRKGDPARTRSFRASADAVTRARQSEIDFDRRGLPPDLKRLERVALSELLARYRDTVIVNKQCAPAETVIINAMLRQPIAKLSLAAQTPSSIANYRDQFG